MRLVDIALTYAQRGWPVFPLEPKGKQPCGRLVPHGLKDASTDEDQIRRWWTSEPDANIGIRTGDAFDVADLDNDQAIETFSKLCKEHGVDPRRLPRQQTGRGGRHLLFEPTGIGNRAKFMPGMDWRGQGGYIVAPGSIHPSGVTYAWITKPNGKMPACPPWLLEMLQPPKQAEATQEQPAGPQEPAPESYVKRALDDEIGALRAAQEGERNDALNRAAFALGQLTGAGWLPHHLAKAELQAAAYAIGLGEPETTRTIQSGLKSGMQDPRQPPPGGFKQAEAGGEIRHGSTASVAEVVQPQKAEETWPAPPADDVYYGLGEWVTRVIRPYAEADPIAILTQFLVAFGIAVNTRPFFMVGATRHTPRVFLGIIGRSSRGRKGTSWEPVEQLLKRADPSFGERIFDGIGSGEKLVHLVRDERRDKDNHITDMGVVDKRLLLQESELARLLVTVNREGSTMSHYLRSAYDGRPLRNLVKSDNAESTNYHIGLIGHSTMTELRSRLTEEQIRNGLGNRIVYVLSRRVQRLPDPEAFEGTEIDNLVEYLRTRRLEASVVTGMQRSPDAQALWKKWYMELPDDTPGTLGALTDRAEAHVLRFSMIYALTDASDTIEVHHLKASLALWDYCQRCVAFIFGGETGNVIADKILEELAFGPLTKNDIYNDVFNRNVSAAQLLMASRLLESQGRLIRERVESEGRGRKAERWRLA